MTVEARGFEPDYEIDAAQAELDDEIERKEREAQAAWDEAEIAAGRDPWGWDDYPL